MAGTSASRPPTFRRPSSPPSTRRPSAGRCGGSTTRPRARQASRPTLPEAQRLLELYEQWSTAGETRPPRPHAWREMLDIHADQVYAIGTIARAPIPLVHAADLKNVPASAIYAWDPGGQLGVHRMDEFFFDEAPVASDRLPRAALRDHAGDAGRDLGADLRHHQPARGQLSLEPDRRDARDGRGGRHRQGRGADARIRARPAALAAIPDLGRR